MGSDAFANAVVQFPRDTAADVQRVLALMPKVPSTAYVPLPVASRVRLVILAGLKPPWKQSTFRLQLAPKCWRLQLRWQRALPGPQVRSTPQHCRYSPIFNTRAELNSQVESQVHTHGSP